MFERFSDTSRKVVVLAQEESRQLGHSYIGTEHILLGVLRAADPTVDAIVRAHTDPLRLREAVLSVLERGQGTESTHITFTPSAKAALESSLREALALGHESIRPVHQLLGLAADPETTAGRLLTQHGLGASVLRADAVSMAGSPDSGSGLATVPTRPASPMRIQTGPVCSFCQRAVSEVGPLAAGPGLIAICRPCAQRALSLLPSD